MTSSLQAIDLDNLGARLLPAVLEAGRLEMAHFTAGVPIEKKADRSPVTVADREAETVIVNALAEIAPGVTIVAEELVAAGQAPEPAERFFLVDALDGTRHFVRGSPEFSINIALVDKGRPVFGLIYGPPSGRLFLTRSDGNSYEARVAAGDGSAVFSQLAFSRLRTREPDAVNLRAYNSITAGGASAGLLRALGVKDAKPLGSAIKFSLIAAGEGDLYARIGETYEWDTASGQAILEAAGGAVTDLAGRPMSYGHAARGYLNGDFIAWGRCPPEAEIRALVSRSRNA